MNKKLLMATMSLVALAACTDNDFQSQNQKMAEEVSPVQFEIVNGNDAMTRATLPVNTIVWSAEDKDLFTLYHGGILADGSLNGLGNATYTATPVEGEPAVLTTPSMINAGKAIMVWPVDTTFRCEGNNLMIDIPAVQNPSKNPITEADQGLANIIPYVSDLIEISPYIIAGTETTAERPSTEADFNRAGYNRKYPVYMRPMASQLNLHTDYQYASPASKDAYDALVNDTDDPIEEIYATSVALITDAAGADKFTTKIPVIFAEANADKKGLWNAKVAENAWTHVTGLNIADIPAAGKVNRLETTCPISTGALKDGCKFLILPQANIAEGVDKGAIEVNTYYGSVLVADPVAYPESKYTTDEYNAAWYRYVTTRLVEGNAEENASVATGMKDSKNRDLWKNVAKSPALGMQQTINTFSTYTVDLNADKPVAQRSIVAGEYMGVASDRYLIVNLKHLDMSNLHIKTDKQLRDVVRVWNALGLDPVTVFLDDDKNADDTDDEGDDFHITQETIEIINTINDAKKTELNPIPFKVKPCQVGDEDHGTVSQIVITGGGEVKDIAFIAPNGEVKAEVVLAEEDTPWIWEGDVKVTAAGVKRIINEGTMLNEETATLRTVENNGTQNYVPLINYGTWNIGVEGQTEGTRLNVQFGVTNMGLVTINKKAQYIQDKTTFNNGASTLPERFLAAGVEEKFGEVDNFGVFATVNNGTINNVGLIEHADKDAKTYITRNQSANDGVNFANPFAGNNKMGTINLPYSNKEEDNISISAELAEGFVSVTISDTPATEAPAGGILNEAVVGHKVNYVNIVGGVTEIQQLPAQIKYVEINEPGTEIVWNLVDDPTTVDNPETADVVENDESVATYEGLIVLSDVNIKLNTTIKVTKACYLGADMYVGGYFNPDKTKAQLKTWTGWNGYYGDTTTNFESQYITY